MEKLNDCVWRYQDEIGATAYLVVGSQKALMIDCGTGLSPLMPEIRKVTDKPVSLVLTHGHPDHYGASYEFEEIAIHRDDADIAAWFSANYAALPAPPVPMERVQAIDADHVFDLGDRQIRVLPLPGHTPGSILLVDDVDRMVFTGDAIGSGDIVLMAIEKALPLREYVRHLKNLLPLLPSLQDYTWHGGHYTQAGEPGTPEYNPIGPHTVRDLIELCEGIINGSIQGERVQEVNSPTGFAFRAYHSSAGIVW